MRTVTVSSIVLEGEDIGHEAGARTAGRRLLVTGWRNHLGARTPPQGPEFSCSPSCREERGGGCFPDHAWFPDVAPPPLVSMVLWLAEYRIEPIGCG